jgi:hypothetical protein
MSLSSLSPATIGGRTRRRRGGNPKDMLALQGGRKRSRRGGADGLVTPQVVGGRKRSQSRKSRSGKQGGKSKKSKMSKTKSRRQRQ